MEPESALPRLQVPATCPYPEPACFCILQNLLSTNISTIWGYVIF
jgi:hypothetical protein